MDSIWIKGGNKLKGEIPISGAKNAALTLMPCALLTDETLTLRNLPRLADVDTFGHLLNQLGVSTSVAGVKKGEYGRRMTLQASEIASTPSSAADSGNVSRQRANSKARMSAQLTGYAVEAVQYDGRQREQHQRNRLEASEDG